MCYKLWSERPARLRDLLGHDELRRRLGLGADEKESHRILAFYVEAGSNFIDTRPYMAREQERHSH
jgi:hypothetical protein